MKTNYRNIIQALSEFSEGLWLPNVDSLGCIGIAVNAGYLDIEELKSELNIAISSKDFNWVDLSNESSLLIDASYYTNIEITNYVKLLLWEYLYPNIVLGLNQIERLTENVSNILKNFFENEGWIFSYELYDLLKKDRNYSNLEYYNLWHIDYVANNIERIPIAKKDREIGYLRYIK